LTIQRGVWATHVGPTKTASSEGQIPVLPMLAELLRNRRERLSAPKHGYVFANKQGGPLDFHNLPSRVIRRALEGSAVEWNGFRGFRRGLASNLFDLGVHPKVVAAILRHDVMTA
jgi:integrase